MRVLPLLPFPRAWSSALQEVSLKPRERGDQRKAEARTERNKRDRLLKARSKPSPHPPAQQGTRGRKAWERGGMACFLTLFISPTRGSWCILTPSLSSQCSQSISREAGSRGCTPINSPGPSRLQRDLHPGHTGQRSSSRPCGDLLSNALPCPEPLCVAVTHTKPGWPRGPT